MELREKIRRLLFEADGTCDWSPVAGERCGQLADAILALPEIAEALKLATESYEEIGAVVRSTPKIA